MAWHEAYDFLALQTILVLAILALAWWLWRRTGSLGFPLGIMVLYFWSLHGSWTVIHDLWQGLESARYQYLFERMFPVRLDPAYLATMGLYGLFILTVGTTCLLFARPPVTRPARPEGPVKIQHGLLLMMSALTLLGSILIVRGQLVEIVLMNRSGYSLTSGGAESVSLFSLHQVLNRLCVMPLAIGVPLLLSEGRGRFLTARSTIPIRLGYLVLVVAVIAHAFLLGNKAEAFAGLLTGTLMYLANTPRARLGRLVAGGLIFFVAIALVDYVRTVPLGDLLSGQVDQSRALRAPLEIFNSNEAFATHFSLYGILAYDVPLIHGRGLLALITAFVPRLLWPDRPAVTYVHYADSLGLPEDQGFTLHHASGWYLNFGIPGVLIGGAILGLVWAVLFNRMGRGGRGAIVGLVGFAFMTGGLADFLRAGIASYKGLLLYNIIFPWLTVMLASWQPFPRPRTGNSPQVVEAP